MNINFAINVDLTREEQDHIAKVREEEHLTSRTTCNDCLSVSFKLLDAMVPQLRHRLGLP